MALSATEEALVRQLLDQQAAILSLAGNEATITSKLGATKVTLADLVAASSLADADLLLTRQGTNDKSVRADILAAYMGAELGALFAPIANPTFTGDPKAPTAAQFDNDTSLATTAFVQRAIGNARDYTSLAATTNMDESHAGKIIHFGADGITLNLPPTASVANGTVVTLWNGNSNNSFIGKQGSDIIAIANSTYSSIPSGLNETYSFVRAGTQWILIGGSGLNKYVRSFQSVMTTFGYQRLPSGVIIQTGRGTFNKAVSVSLPIAFPTAFVGFAAVHVGSDNTANPTLNGYTTSTINLNWANAAGTNDAVWIAIGY